MFLKLKKFTLVVSLIFGVQASIPHQAHAIVAAGAAIAGSGGLAGVLAIAGASSFGGGAAIIFIPGLLGHPVQDGDGFLPALSIILTFLGLFLLPGDSQNQAPELIALHPSQAPQLHSSQAEINEYNAHLIEINMAKQEITADIQSGKITSDKQIRQAWLTYQNAGLISPAAFKVLEQVSNQVVETLKKEL